MSAVAALEAAVRPAVENPAGCFVTFSGGHDSSLILATATRVARQGGLPLPVPVTFRFPDVPAASESEIQDAVVADLGLTDWIRIGVRDELDLVGPWARGVLRREGVRTAPNAFMHDHVYALAAGGHVLVGAGGDEVFGRSIRPRRPWLFSPRKRSTSVPWLRPAAREVARLTEERHRRQLPRRAAERPRWRTGGRDMVLRHETHRRLAAARGARVDFPLADRRVVEAVVGSGLDAVSIGGRSNLVAALFSDVLPEVVTAPRPKAEFSDVFWRRHARRHAETWDGSGVDRRLVDVTALRDTWRHQGPVFRSMMLLQQTWLANDDGTDDDLEDPRDG